MDTEKWKSIANFRDLMRELRQISSHLFSMREQIGSIGEQEQRRQAQEDRQSLAPPPSPVISSELHIPEAQQTQQRARDNRQLAVQIILAIGTWFAFGAAAIYGYVAIRQWREMISNRHQTEQAIHAASRSATAAETANNNTFAANRPWIGPVFGEEAPIFRKITNTV
jgi:hypothetical protein